MAGNGAWRSRACSVRNSMKHWFRRDPSLIRGAIPYCDDVKGPPLGVGFLGVLVLKIRRAALICPTISIPRFACCNRPGGPAAGYAIPSSHLRWYPIKTSGAVCTHPSSISSRRGHSFMILELLASGQLRCVKAGLGIAVSKHEWVAQGYPKQADVRDGLAATFESITIRTKEWIGMNTTGGGGCCSFCLMTGIVWPI